jgi:hypothetical protein
MAVTLIVNNVPFDYPEQGEQQPWGESATNWASEVTKVLASLKSSSDILETAAAININQTTPDSIQGLFFDSLTVRSFIVTGNITRTTSTAQKYEEFELRGLYQGPTLGWALQQESLSNSGVTFSISSSGQVQYVSTTVSGDPLTYSGLIKFKAVALSQT